jgi:hypothetical protein
VNQPLAKIIAWPVITGDTVVDGIALQVILDGKHQAPFVIVRGELAEDAAIGKHGAAGQECEGRWRYDPGWKVRRSGAIT